MCQHHENGRRATDPGPVTEAQRYPRLRHFLHAATYPRRGLRAHDGRGQAARHRLPKLDGAVEKHLRSLQTRYVVLTVAYLTTV